MSLALIAGLNGTAQAIHATSMVLAAGGGNGDRGASATHSAASGAGSSSHDSHDSPDLTRALLTSNAAASISLLALCFVVTLVATLVPYVCMRREAFAHWQILTLSVWHAFIAGVLLAAAWTVFLPNMLTVARHMSLASPTLPFVLLFLALLLPLVLDKFMLYLVGSKRARINAATGEELQHEPETPRSEAQTPTPHTPMTRLSLGPRMPQQPPSRKTSLIGGTSEFDERKMMLTPSRGGLAGPSSSRRGLSMDESMPLTGGSDIEAGTPHGTPGPYRYGAATREVDAIEFKARQPYLARCAFCKENIATAKSAAYHAAGCELKSFHAFSFSSRWMQGLRGRRSAQREILMHEEEAYTTSGGGAGGSVQQPTTVRTAGVGWAIACYVVVLCAYNVALAGGVNFQQAARIITAEQQHTAAGTHPSSTDTANNDEDSIFGFTPVSSGTWFGELVHVGLVGLVLFCFTWFYGFSLGMMLRLHRIPLRNWRAGLAILTYAASLPAAIVLNAVCATEAHAESRARVHTYEAYLLVCQCACVGVLIYCSFLDMILEEWARRDILAGKTVAFGVGATLVCVVALIAPI